MRSPPGEHVAIGMGSNLGDRRGALHAALRALRSQLIDVRVSSVWETEPIGPGDQPLFLNACCTALTRQSPRQLLSTLQDIERRAGRTRSGPRYGPRPLDLDLLLYGRRVIETPDLIVPHPRMRERAFVLLPLREIAGGWRVPGPTGRPDPVPASRRRVP